VGHLGAILEDVREHISHTLGRHNRIRIQDHDDADQLHAYPLNLLEQKLMVTDEEWAV